MVDYIQCILDVWQARKYAIGQNSAKQKAANWLKIFLMCTESINTFYGILQSILLPFENNFEQFVKKSDEILIFRNLQINSVQSSTRSFEVLTLHIILLGSCSIVSDIWRNSLLCSWLKNDKSYKKHWQ